MKKVMSSTTKTLITYPAKRTLYVKSIGKSPSQKRRSFQKTTEAIFQPLYIRDDSALRMYN